MLKTPKIGPFVLFLCAAAFVGLRVRGLTHSCLWFDEIFSVHAATLGFGDLFRFVAADLVHPPLFYVLLKIWIAAGGESLGWLRSFPLVFSILSIVPLNYLCREFGLTKFGATLVFLFVAANGCLINYAQEVRMYSLLLFLALTSMWLFMRFLRLGKNIWLLTIVNVLLVYTHYFGWFAVICEVVVIVAMQRIKFRQIAIMTSIAIAAFVPWLLMLRSSSVAASELARNVGWIETPNAATLLQFVIDLVEPFYYPLSSAEPASVYVVAIPLLVVMIAAIIAGLATSDLNAGREKLLVLAVFIGLPVIVTFTVSWLLPYAVWGTRHLIIVFVPVALFAAWAFDSLRSNLMKAVLTIVVGVVLAIGLSVESSRVTAPHIWCAWENFAPQVNTTVYVFDDSAAYSMWFAGRLQNIDVARVTGIDEIPRDVQFFLPRGFDAVRRVTVGEIADERFFIAFRARYFDKSIPPLSNFADRGDKIGSPKVFAADVETGYLVEVTR